MDVGFLMFSTPQPTLCDGVPMRRTYVVDGYGGNIGENGLDYPKIEEKFPNSESQSSTSHHDW